MKVVKDKNLDIISGTEQAYQKENKTFNEKWKEHKIKYLKENTLEDMVYENGSALALLYKEIQRLNTLLQSNLQIDGKED